MGYSSVPRDVFSKRLPPQVETNSQSQPEQARKARINARTSFALRLSPKNETECIHGLQQYGFHQSLGMGLETDVESAPTPEFDLHSAPLASFLAISHHCWVRTLLSKSGTDQTLNSRASSSTAVKTARTARTPTVPRVAMRHSMRCSRLSEGKFGAFSISYMYSRVDTRRVCVFV